MPFKKILFPENPTVSLIMLFFAVAVFVLNILEIRPIEVTVQPAQIRHKGGFMYYAQVNLPLPKFSGYFVNLGIDDNKNPSGSTPILHENDRLFPLDLAHSSHDDIRRLGKGRYTFSSFGGADLLVFSSSDNSDPGTNGRVYKYRCGMSPTPLLLWISGLLALFIALRLRILTALFLSPYNSRADAVSRLAMTPDGTRPGYTYGLPPLLLLGASMVANAPYFIKGQSVFFINFLGSGNAASLWLQHAQFHAGIFGIPLWTNRIMAGISRQYGVNSYDPLMILFSWLDFPTALVMLDSLFRFLGAIGMWLLLRRYGARSLAALVAALLVPFGGFLASHGSDFSYGIAILQLPLLIWSIDRLFERPVAVRCGLTVLIGTLFFTATVVQCTSYIFFYLLLPWVVLRLIAPEPGDADRPKVLGAILVTGSVLLLIVNLELVAQWQGLQYSDRVGSEAYLYKDLGVTLWMIFLTPLVLWLLKLANPWLRIPLALLAVACVAPLMGEGVSWNLMHFYTAPPQPFVYHHQTLEVLFTPLQLLLAGLALASFHRVQTGQRLLAQVVALAIVYRYLGADYIDIHYADRSMFIIWLLVLVGVGLGLDRMMDYWATRERPDRWPVFLPLVALLVVGEGGWFYHHYRLPRADITLLDAPATPMSTFLQRADPLVRVLDVYENEHMLWPNGLPVDERLQILRWMFPVYYGVETYSRVGISFVPGWANRFYNQAVPLYFGADPANPVNPYLDVAAVSHIISAIPLTSHSLKQVGGDKAYQIYQNPTAWPRVQLFASAEAVSDDQAMERLGRLAEGQLPPHLFLAEGTPLPRTDSDRNTEPGYRSHGPGHFSSGLGEAEVVEHTAEQLRLHVRVDRPVWVGLSDTYYPGWRAWLGQQEIPVVRANVAFRGFHLPAGDHLLEMRFDPSYMTPSLLLFKLGCFLMVILLLAGNRFLPAIGYPSHA